MKNIGDLLDTDIRVEVLQILKKARLEMCSAINKPETRKTLSSIQERHVEKLLVDLHYLELNLIELCPLRKRSQH